MRIVKVSDKEVDLNSIEVDGIDTKDYPDFCDAYVAYAEFIDGEPLNDTQLETLRDDYPEIVHEAVFERVF